jgi:hypothetical protein
LVLLGCLAVIAVPLLFMMSSDVELYLSMSRAFRAAAALCVFGADAGRRVSGVVVLSLLKVPGVTPFMCVRWGWDTFAVACLVPLLRCNLLGRPQAASPSFFGSVSVVACFGDIWRRCPRSDRGVSEPELPSTYPFSASPLCRRRCWCCGRWSLAISHPHVHAGRFVPVAGRWDGLAFFATW